MLLDRSRNNLDRLLCPQVRPWLADAGSKGILIVLDAHVVFAGFFWGTSCPSPAALADSPEESHAA